MSDEFGNRVDLLVGLRGLEAAAFSRVLEVPFQGERLRIIGREDFIAMKLFVHGPQDVVDAEFAVAVAGDDLDLPLLKRLATHYGRETVVALEKVLTPSDKNDGCAPQYRPWREVAGVFTTGRSRPSQ